MKKIIILIGTLLFSINIFADVVLKTSTLTPRENETFRLIVAFNNEKERKIEIKGIENLDVISTSKSSSAQYIYGKNGRESIQQTILTYDVYARKSGIIELQGILDNNTKTNILTLNVQENNLTKDKILEYTNNINGKTFYAGEEILYVETLVNNSDNHLYYGINELPKGITIDMLDRYRVTAIPAKSSTQVYSGIIKPIIPQKYNFKQSLIRYRLNYDYGNIGGNNVEFEVLPLPDGKPNDFSGLIGKPNLKYSWGKKELNYGESTTLNIELSGNVNLDSLDKIINSTIENLNYYEQKDSSTVTIDSNLRLYRTQNYKIDFIPLTTGEFSVPEIKISYFNKDTKKYEYLTIPKTTLKVNGKANVQPITSQINGSNSIENNSINNSVIVPENNIVIENISDDTTSNITNKWIIILGIVAILELGIIIYLIIGKRLDSSFKKLKKSKNISEIYNNYCEIMIEKFNFNPRINTIKSMSEIGFSDEFIEIAKELDKAYAKNLDFDIKRLIDIMKKELKKNEK